MLKTDVLLHVFVETVINLIFQLFWWIESSKEEHLFETEIFCYIINIFIVPFDQFKGVVDCDFTFLTLVSV